MMEAPRKSKLSIDLIPGVTRPPTEAAKRHQKPGLTSSVRLAQPILYCVILRAVVPRLKARVRREVSGLVSAAEIKPILAAAEQAPPEPDHPIPDSCSCSKPRRAGALRISYPRRSGTAGSGRRVPSCAGRHNRIVAARTGL